MKRLVLNVAGLFVAIVAVLFGLPSLYLMAAILWLIPAVSYLMGWFMLGGLTCERTLPVSATAGEPVALSYTLENVSRLPKFYLLVRDKLPGGLSFVGGAPPLVLSLWPGEVGETHGVIEAQRRGVFSLGPAQIYSTDPLGLQTFSQRLPQVAELVVYPAVLPLRDSWLRGVAAQGWRGTASALTRGSGDDFYGVREYGPGDELRRVHWRTTARTGVLAVTEYAQGVTLDVVVALDLNQSAYEGLGEDESGALECAVMLAVALLDDLLRHGHTVRLLSQATTPDDAQPTTRTEQMPQFLEALARVRPDAMQTLVAALSEDQRLGASAATLVVITPGYDDPRLSDFLTDWEARGGQSFGLALDPGSFRTGRASLPDGYGGANVRIVRRGADLQATLEGNEYGWNA